MNNMNNTRALVIEVRMDDGATPAQAKNAISKARRILDIAVQEPTGAWGIKLRESAKIVLRYNGSEKVIQTLCCRNVSEGSSGLIPRRFTRKEAFERTVGETRKVFAAMMRYAQFAELVRAAKHGVGAPPAEHPTAYWVRFVRPLFGTRVQDLHLDLLCQNRRVPVEDDSEHVCLTADSAEVQAVVEFVG